MASKTQQEVIQSKALEALAELGGRTFQAEEDIVFQGTKLILPVGSSLSSVRTMLDRFEEEQAAKVQFSRKYNFRPWDVAYNGVKALRDHFGMVSHRGTFMSPPQLVDVPVGVNETVQVPWGRFQIPALPEVTFAFGADFDPDYGQVGTIGASGPKKFAFEIQGVFNLVEAQLRKTSIYKGKAIDGQDMPQFIDVASLNEELIVYSAQVEASLGAKVFAPLRYPEVVQAEGIKLKRAILLHGEFGTGKTLTLTKAAKIAVEHGWTAIMVRPGRDNIEEAMRTARAYAPTLIAVEDVDTVVAASEEANRISRMLDLFDGVDAKNQKIQVVLTTNHVEVLHAGMLRPGRLDAIIHIGAPDAAGSRKLIEVNNSRLDENIDWEAVGEATRGYLPAFIAQVSQDALAYAIDRTEGQLEGKVITTEDLVFAAGELRAQWELQQGAGTGEEPPELDRAVKHLVELAISGKLDDRLLVNQN